MKQHLYHLFLFLFIISFLIGCKKDEVSARIEAEISSLGDITIDDETQVNKIYERYNTLTDAQKSQVSNYNELLDAIDEIDRLKTEQYEEAITSMAVEKLAETEETQEQFKNELIALLTDHSLLRTALDTHPIKVSSDSTVQV